MTAKLESGTQYFVREVKPIMEKEKEESPLFFIHTPEQETC